MRINAQRMVNFWLLFLAFIVISVNKQVNAKKHCRHHSCFNEEEDPCACESGSKYGRKDDYPGYKLEFVQSVRFLKIFSLVCLPLSRILSQIVLILIVI